MRTFGVGLALSLGLVGCLSTGTVTSSTGNSPGTGSGSGLNGTVGGSSTGGAMAGTSSGAGTSGGSTTGGPACLTAANCIGGDVCLDGGCGAPKLPNLNCVGVGETCSPTGTPCCQGICGAGGFCTAWAPCAVLGTGCQASAECCWSESCDAGTCTPSCGNLATPCAQDSDCCTGLGLLCRPPQVPNGNAMECVSEGGVSEGCLPTASVGSVECDLGTACKVPQVGDDPCAPAGYVCDPFLGVCRLPYPYEKCLPGGPPCLGISGTSVDDLRCVVLNNLEGPLCLQACQETSDCTNIETACIPVPGTGGSACLGNYSCSDAFGPCSAEGMNDGTCIPIQSGDNLCEQSALDAGPTCSDSANRQSGGLCGVGDSCIAGLCSAVCNAGTTGVPGCDGGTCVAGEGNGDPVDYGFCEQACDFVDLDGGGCPSSPEVPEKCIAAFMSGLPDNGNGICALASPNPPAIGQHCSQQDPTVIDQCGPGAACAALEGGAEVICVRLCKNPGTFSNCPAGQACQYWFTNGIRSTIMGSCG